MPRQLSAFARLGTLGHFNLQLVGIDQILARDPEPAADATCLIGAVAEIAIGVALIPNRVFAPFTGVADVHRYGSWRWPASHGLHG